MGLVRCIRRSAEPSLDTTLIAPDSTRIDVVLGTKQTKQQTLGECAKLEQVVMRFEPIALIPFPSRTEYTLTDKRLVQGRTHWFGSSEDSVELLHITDISCSEGYFSALLTLQVLNSTRPLEIRLSRYWGMRIYCALKDAWEAAFVDAVANPMAFNTWGVLSQALPNTALSPLKLDLNLDVMSSFAGRAENFTNALDRIAKYLPKEGPACQAALEMVADQRKFVHGMNVAVQSLMGRALALDVKTLNVLDMMWKGALSVTVTQKQAVQHLQKARLFVEQLAEECECVLKLVDSCRKQHTELTVLEGKGTKRSDIILEVIKQYGGRQQNKALEQDLEGAEVTLTTAEKKLAIALDGVIAAQIAEEDLSGEVWVKNMELAKLRALARDTVQVCAVAREEATNAINRSEHCDLVTQENAAQLLADDSQRKMRDAEVDAAKLKSELVQRQLSRANKEKLWEGAACECRQARTELDEKKRKVEAKRKDFGGLDPTQFSTLHAQLQKLPAVLGEKERDDIGMFAIMHGALTNHRNFCNTILMFLSRADEPKQVQSLLCALRPQIQYAMQHATLFTQIKGDTSGNFCPMLQSADKATACSVRTAKAAVMPPEHSESPVIFLTDEPL